MIGSMETVYPEAAPHMRAVREERMKLAMSKAIRSAEVIEAVCTVCQVNESDLFGGSRERTVHTAKKVAVVCLRDLCGMSYPEIARAMRQTSHSVAHARYRSGHTDQCRAMVEHVTNRITRLRCAAEGIYAGRDQD